MLSCYRPTLMTWPSAEQLDDLVLRFRECRLPKEEWTHLAHLAVGTWHVRALGPEAAVEQLRERIRRLNDSHGTPNTETRGYHETITRAYVLLIADLLRTWPVEAAPGECARAVLASAIAPKDSLLIYYSKDRLMSVEARLGWVEPDRRALAADREGQGTTEAV
jgi:hypothetical protein